VLAWAQVPAAPLGTGQPLLGAGQPAGGPGQLAAPAGRLAAENTAPLTMTLAATGEYQYNSNVFDLQPGFTVLGLPANSRLYDTTYTFTAAYDIKYQWQQQTVFADLAGSDILYDYYTQLNHHEYRVDAGWSGKVGDVVDGNFAVIRDQSMISFQELNLGIVRSQSTLSLSTEQREQGGLGVQVLPRWRIEGSAYSREVTWPLPGEPNLKLDESEGQVAIKYLGTAALTSGAGVAYLSGNYTGASIPALNPPYQQRTASLVANYMGGRSNFVGQVGYSSRTSSGIDSAINNISGVTGSLSYDNQLTAKTSVAVVTARLINSNITNSGSEIDNTAALTLHWQPTFKTGASVGYNYTYSQFPAQGNPPGSNRLDHLQLAILRLDYEALRWLAIKPYASYQLRRSNLIGGDFDASIYGVDLKVQWQK
jgi:hypothetical protein